MTRRFQSLETLTWPVAGISLIIAGMAFSPFGCDSDPGDDDDSPADTSPSPAGDDDDATETSPTPTPPPVEIWRLPAEHKYKSKLPFSFDFFVPPVAGYKAGTWQSEFDLNDDDTITGYNLWLFWKSGTATSDPPDCSMPETFVGVKAAGVPGDCPDCEFAYDITFSPMEAETTCPQGVVSNWNGAADPYGDWDDTWAFLSVADHGYPAGALGGAVDYNDYADTFDSWGAEYIEYDVWFAAEYTADMVVGPYCTADLTENCMATPVPAAE